MANKKNRKSTSSAKTEYEPTRTGLSPETIARALLDNLYYVQGRIREVATPHDWYAALAYTVRDRLLKRWTETLHTLLKQDTRVVSYLSAEFLMGPHLGNALVNLGHLRGDPSGGGPAGARSERPPGTGRGAGPGQRRSRAAGRLFPGFAGNAGDPRHRLRHPL